MTTPFQKPAAHRAFKSLLPVPPVKAQSVAQGLVRNATRAGLIVLAGLASTAALVVVLKLAGSVVGSVTPKSYGV